jgi:type VII secretion effector (TIGR04197 family)
MELRSDQVIANNINKNIISSVNPLKGIIFNVISGGNTGGLLQANSFRSSLPVITSRYEAVLERDSNKISTLADTFTTIDQDMANQME